ncbi:SAM-dependent methyltransferase [Paramagnetospirillum kuznetsovii]|uniref:SAM-dependent methyltransferase n=1 Tax=Paramagnetospirillum kuznetsovii TaxID=2053833 RepID=A0A364NUT4_9PROT|nr:class I SAM-dependent methyltransferase [Paramagnetospirillum kuznetsovii]RAU20826.1 SAM-dependent methyltransferase [Paramagnetospirillum kuznetsovii]
MTLNTENFVPETHFGDWFIKSDTWKTHVLCRAMNDLQRLIPVQAGPFHKVIDVGCGFGHSFDELARRFAPKHIIGMDAVPDIQNRAQAAAARCAVPVTLHSGSASRMDFPDDEFDMVFCHQTFHHLVDPDPAMSEFFRVLKPGGILLFAESTKRYIHSLPIRLLFRHPMEVQKTAEEYIALMRQVGFDLPAERISQPYLWWSRPDIGFLEWIGLPVPAEREETLVNAIAMKPSRS